ncbi:MAG: sugar phosphate nucleotidyltransferase, partial [Gammaproteobacteria bacterium]|nr:sugar phosphate nucleotidyltransferase [Gammaproteobacteria bacterium]
MFTSDLNDTLTMVTAIGDGKSLEPLTARRATAAMPFGGSYRIIDFALTNCLHSGQRRILVLTQYNALSLQTHIRDGWSIYNSDLGEFITPITPPIREGVSTYAGLADALLKNLYLIDGASEENILLVSGEQIYRMDYSAVLAHHANHDADVTIAGVPAANANGARFSVALEVDGVDVTALHCNAKISDAPDNLLWPIQVCVIKRKKLVELLSTLNAADRTDISLTELIGAHLDLFKRVLAYRFGETAGRVTQDRYWRTLDDLDAYYD